MSNSDEKRIPWHLKGEEFERWIDTLRGERDAALQQLGEVKRSRCPISTDAEYAAYRAGYTYGVEHGQFDVEAKADLRLYPEDQDLRIAWDRGLAHCHANVLLGHDVRMLLDCELYWVDDEAAAVIAMARQRDELRAHCIELEAEAAHVRTAVEFYLADRGEELREGIDPDDTARVVSFLAGTACDYERMRRVWSDMARRERDTEAEAERLREELAEARAVREHLSDELGGEKGGER